MMQHWTEGKQYFAGVRIGMAYELVEIPSNAECEMTPSFRIVFVREGTGMMTLGESRYPVVAPSLFCLNEKEHVRFIAGEVFKLQSVAFDPAVLNDQLARLLRDDDAGHDDAVTVYQDRWILDSFFERSESYIGSMLLDGSTARYAAETIEEIGSNLIGQPDSFWPCRSRSYLMELLFRIRLLYQKMSYVPDALPRTESDTLRPIIEYLHIYYKHKIKLEDLTARFHVNRTTLNEWFKQATGLPVIAYLCSLRMRIADPMLRNTTLPMTEIMEMVGFRDDAHFIRQFRKYSGHSPAEYRNLYASVLR
jgi:AraC family L-rhamnose operon regulatory protein RhaS